MTLIRLLCIAAATVSFLCVSTGPNAGSETTSGVKIASSGDTISVIAVAGTTLMIFDARYSPGDTLRYTDTVVVGDSGTAEITNLPSGLYNVFAYPNSSNTGAVVRGIPVNANNSVSPILDSALFSSLKSITGTVTKQGQPDSLAEVFIAGSFYYSKTDIQGGFLFEKVPPGTYLVVARDRFSGSWKQFVTDSLNVAIANNDSTYSVTVHLTLQ